MLKPARKSGLESFEYWNDIIETLDMGGMTRDPLILKACKLCNETGYYKLLRDILTRKPQILMAAKRNISEQKKFPFMPYPWKRKDLAKLSGKYDIGIINNNGDRAGLDPIDFTRGLFICGETGSGKSYPSLRLMKQIFSEPIDKRGFNVIVVQSVKRDADFLLNTNKDIVILDWQDIRRSPLFVEPWDKQASKISSFCDVYSSVNWLMMHGQPLLSNTLKICLNKFGNDTNFEHLFDHVDLSAKYIGLLGPEHRNSRDHLKFSLFSFKETGSILNCRRGFSVSEFFTKKDIILNLLDQKSDYIIATFITDLLLDIKRYYEQDPQQGKLRTLIIIDESRRVLAAKNPNSQTGHNPSAPMIEVVTTRRSAGIGIIALTQEPQSAPDWLTNNSAYVLVMVISGRGRKEAQELINLSKVQSDYIDCLPSFGEGIMRYSGFDRRIVLKVPSDLDDTPIPPAQISELMKDRIKELHSTIDESISGDISDLHNISGISKNISNKSQSDNDKSKAFDIKQQKKLTLDKMNSLAIIDILLKNPFVPFTEIRDTLKISAQRMRDAVEYMNSRNLLVSVKCLSLKNRTAEYLVLTDRISEKEKSVAVSPFMFKHRMYEQRVADCLNAKGYTTTIEFQGDDIDRSNAAKTIKINTSDGREILIPKRIDVFAVHPTTKERIAFEITLSFSNLMDNIHKCLEIFHVDVLRIVTENEEAKSYAMNLVSNKVPGYLAERIKFNTMKDFSM